MKYQKEKKDKDDIFEVKMTENFQKLMTDTNHRPRKLRENQDKYKKKTKTTLRYIIFKLQETDKVLKEDRVAGRGLIYREIRIRIMEDFSSETVQASRE